MKGLLTLSLSLLCICAISQPYGKVELVGHMANGLRPGMIFSAGKIFRDKDTKKSTAMLGAGVGVIAFDFDSPPYIPIFIEGGYYASYSKVTPYVAGKVGWAIYDGNGEFIGKQKFAAKGGLYTNIRAGIGFGITKRIGIAPFFGVSYIQISDRNKYQKEDYYKAMLDFGIAIIL
jgi:hypothetical protein